MFPFDTENFMIYLDNLSAYHVFFDVLSFFAFVFTIWFCRRNNVKDDTQSTEGDDSSSNVDDIKDDGIASSEKPFRQRALMEQITANLSENELEEEKRIEKMQLEKIFELLRKQEDKFQMTSMDQLQDQLSLYRI